MFIADFHIHSKYSRATSRDCDLEHIDMWARKKGIGVVGTGDFTHPAWRAEMELKLLSEENGLYRLKDEYILSRSPAYNSTEPKFIITGEISSIYKKGDKVRKVHNTIFLPSIEAADLLARKLEKIGNIHSDGRPILGLDSKDLLEITLDSCPDAVFIPAHIWTPHFSLFGAFSGFNFIEECFEDLTENIFALETGLSSDPPMNWRVPQLDKYTLVSNSDAHSPSKLGREANIFDSEVSYKGIKRALETKQGFLGTIEFFPEEGKYHLDGHRKCGLRIQPSKTVEYNGKCPICGRKITIGVQHRVEELAQREDGYVPDGAAPFEHLVPLPEVISASTGLTAGGVKNDRFYERLLNEIGSEFYILRQAPKEQLYECAGPCVAEGIERLRKGQVERIAGFDGEYGKIKLFDQAELDILNGQTALFQMAASKKPSEDIKHELKKKNISEPENKEDISKKAAPPNSEQSAAIKFTGRTLAVIAGPGTGKTRTLVSRIDYLINEIGVKPSEITAVTFTNQAASEMKDRLASLLGKKRAGHLKVGTFHSICIDILSVCGKSVNIIGETEALDIAEAVLKAEKLQVSSREFLQTVSRIKTSLESKDNEIILSAFEKYNEKLKELHVYDFDDILNETLCIMSDSEYDSTSFNHLLVDEFQDINNVQYKLIKEWRRCGKTLFVIGDPDQSIYGFRGSDPGCFQRLQNDYPELKNINLKINYRSSPDILKGALSVISGQDGINREITTVETEGAPVRICKANSDFSEAVFVAKEISRMAGGIDMLEAHGRGYTENARPFSDICILARTHRQTELLEKCLVHDGIPCIVTGREDYLNDESVRGTLGFFGYLNNPSDNLSVKAALKFIWKCPDTVIAEAENFCLNERRLITEQDMEYFNNDIRIIDLIYYLNKYKKGRREKPYKSLERWIQDKGLSETKAIKNLLGASVFYNDSETFVKDLLFGQESDLKRSSSKNYASGAVRIMTLHGSKGLEFPVVFICGVNDDMIPMKSSKYKTDVNEERRLMYVGMTRAREELIISYAGSKSEFIENIPEQTCLYENIKETFFKPQQLSLF